MYIFKLPLIMYNNWSKKRYIQEARYSVSILIDIKLSFAWQVAFLKSNAVQLKLDMFIKCIGWIRSPEGDCTICSSSATFLQLNPSAANSRVLRAAFWFSSLAELHICSRTKLGYSVRIGICMTATSFLRDTLRLDFVFLDSDVQLVWAVNAPSDVYASMMNKW